MSDILYKYIITIYQTFILLYLVQMQFTSFILTLEIIKIVEICCCAKLIHKKNGLKLYKSRCLGFKSRGKTNRQEFIKGCLKMWIFNLSKYSMKKWRHNNSSFMNGQMWLRYGHVLLLFDLLLSRRVINAFIS